MIITKQREDSTKTQSSTILTTVMTSLASQTVKGISTTIPNTITVGKKMILNSSDTCLVMERWRARSGR